jgi:6,7-dimethyl-8-ribityllumazine synthase
MAEEISKVAGSFDAKGLKFAIVASRFNEFITERMIEGCIDTLQRHGALPEDIKIFLTPGSLEMPVVVQKIAQQKKYDAIICLGCIIRGETFHFEIVAGETAKGLFEISRQTATPIIFGILTAESIEQAMERAGAKLGNKARDAARTAIETVNLLRRVDEKKNKR